MPNKIIIFFSPFIQIGRLLTLSFNIANILAQNQLYHICTFLLYLFSDLDETNAFLCIDLKNVFARSVDREFLKRIIQKRSTCPTFVNKDVPVDRAFILRSAQDTPLVHDVPPPSTRQSQPVQQRVVKSFFGALVPQKLRWVVCVAESKDMNDKWMNSWDQSRLIF